MAGGLITVEPSRLEELVERKVRAMLRQRVVVVEERLTIAEIARLLKYSTRTVRRRIEDGLIKPYEKDGEKITVRASVVNAYRKEYEVNGL